MGFDLQNFGLGLVTGWVTAYGVYRFRRVIGSTVDATRNRATSAQSYATRSADSRYINDLIELCETTHLAGRFAKLSEVVIEPRFLPSPALAAPPDDEVMRDVFHVVPQIHDYPYLHAVYNVETLSIDDLAGGSRTLALLGLPGSGRTTALLSIVLRSLGRLRFEKGIDKIQQRLDAEEAALSEKERAARVKERNKIEELAREKLREQHDIDFTANLDEAQTGTASSFSQLMPVYVHLANIQLRTGEYGEQIDPAEPLVRAVQSQVGPVTAKSIPRNLYKRLTNGQVLLLVDGYDDLPESERAEKLAWVRALTTEYEGNFAIITGPAQGYGALTQIGFTPIFIRPWNDDMQLRIVQRWAEAWPRIGSKKRKAVPPPDDALRERARINNRALSPTDLTLKTWATYADDTEAAGPEGWLRAFAARHLPEDQPIGMILPQMAQAAAVQLDNGYITLARLEALARGIATTSDDDLLDALMESEPPKPAAKPRKKSKEEIEREKKIEEEASAQGKLLSILRNAGLIIGYRSNRYQFRHPFIAAYLASLTLRDVSPEAMAAKALNPAWSQAIAYASLHTSIEPAVHARLNAAPDVLNNPLLETSRWLSYAGSNASWGGPLLKQLGNLLVAPNQYPLLRERAAAALIGTRDKNSIFVFRQAARNANADVRRLACLGMGANGDPEAIKDLVPLLSDKIVDVQLSGVMALGAIGTNVALEEMVLALTEGSEYIRQAVAESLAAVPDEGHPVLFDAIAHEEMMVRRAAAFGLRRVRTNWAVSALYRTFLEDDQWYVRSAAQQAFQDIQDDENKGPQGYPSVDSITWLVNWAAARGEGVPSGEAAIQVLMKALQEGDPELRALAARALGQLGEVSAARSLYAALRDRQEEVRTAAHRSLADFEAQLGQPLPAPI
jgi:HEAT repeat protein